VSFTKEAIWLVFLLMEKLYGDNIVVEIITYSKSWNNHVI